MARFLALGLIAAVASLGVTTGAAAGEDCEYLRRREVGRAIGEKVKAGPPPAGVGGACSFSVRGRALDVVNLWVLEGDDATTGYEVGEDLAGDEGRRLEGIGDRAVYLGDPFNTLYALDGDQLVYLQYYVSSGEEDDPAKIRRAVVKLTKKALRRL